MSNWEIHPLYRAAWMPREDATILTVHRLAAPLGGVVAGGAARYMHRSGRPFAPADIDVFMLKDGDGVALGDAILDLGYSLVRGEDGTYTYRREGYLSVQLVTGGARFKQWETPAQLMDEFSFRCEQFALVDGIEPGVMVSTEGLGDVLLKECVVNYISDPIRVAWRYGKYARKGFVMSAEQMTSIFRYFEEATDAERTRWLLRNTFIEVIGDAPYDRRVNTP